MAGLRPDVTGDVPAFAWVRAVARHSAAVEPRPAVRLSPGVSRRRILIDTPPIRIDVKSPD